MLNPLQPGINVVVAAYLAGGKKAVLSNGTLYVSPAMFDLIRHANRAELQRVMAAIDVVEINIPDLNFFQDIPMTICAPKWEGV